MYKAKYKLNICELLQDNSWHSSIMIFISYDDKSELLIGHIITEAYFEYLLGNILKQFEFL